MAQRWRSRGGWLLILVLFQAQVLPMLAMPIAAMPAHAMTGMVLDNASEAPPPAAMPNASACPHAWHALGGCGACGHCGAAAVAGLPVSPPAHPPARHDQSAPPLPSHITSPPAHPPRLPA